MAILGLILEFVWAGFFLAAAVTNAFTFVGAASLTGQLSLAARVFLQLE